MQETFQKYKKEGNAGVAVSAMITLIIGVAVATLILIFTGALGGQTYNLVQSDIDAITNTTIKNHVQNAITSGFEAQEQTGQYLPLIVLAVVIGLVLALVLSFMAFGGGGSMRGSAL